MLIPDWRRAWRFSSVHLALFGGVCAAAVIATPQAVAQHVPEPVMQFLSTCAVLCPLLVPLGRITRLGKPHDLQPPPAPGGH